MGHDDTLEEERAGWRLTGSDIRVRQEVGFDRSRLAVYGPLPAKREKAWRVPVSPTLQTFFASLMFAKVEVFSGSNNADFLSLPLCFFNVRICCC